MHCLWRGEWQWDSKLLWERSHRKTSETQSALSQRRTSSGGGGGKEDLGRVISSEHSVRLKVVGVQTGPTLGGTCWPFGGFPSKHRRLSLKRVSVRGGQWQRSPRGEARKGPGDQNYRGGSGRQGGRQ